MKICMHCEFSDSSFSVVSKPLVARIASICLTCFEIYNIPTCSPLQNRNVQVCLWNLIISNISSPFFACSELLWPERLADVIMTCLECPWLIHCCRTTTQERRADRIRPPPEASEKCAVHRSDGASRRNGREGGSLAGMGAGRPDT